MGFDPGSLGLCPGPKAGAKPLRHPGIPPILTFNQLILTILILRKVSVNKLMKRKQTRRFGEKERKRGGEREACFNYFVSYLFKVFHLFVSVLVVKMTKVKS